MKVALVHDYLNEFGGAERVLLALSELFPDAPIYTAFYREDSKTYELFKDKKIVTSWAQKVPFFVTKLHSPLRFLAPFIWGSFRNRLADYDVVISSSSWYITKGLLGNRVIRTSGKRESGDLVTRKPGYPIEICYCHTPPRYLYGYPTSVEWQKYWPVRVYAFFVNHFMRVYDFEASQRVNYFIANSKEVASRIKKFYRRSSDVIYPPVELSRDQRPETRKKKTINHERPTINEPYFLVVSRIVGGKGISLAIEAANKMGFKLKVVGKAAGYGAEDRKIHDIAGDNVEFLGYVEDSELVELYAGAKAFLALATDEDFGITPVEAMLCGTPVIAYNGGGYKETVVDGKTGLFFDSADAESLSLTVKRFLSMDKKFDKRAIKRHAQKFGKERFKREILKFVEAKVKS